MAIDSTHIQYSDVKLDWVLIRNLIKGERAIKDATTTYLPKLSGQDSDEYLSYRNRPAFYNAFGRTVQGLTGAIMRKDPDVTASDPVIETADRLTRDHRSLREVATSAIKDVIAFGRYGVLVDAPVDGGDAYVAEYRAEDILNWYQEEVGDGYILTFLALRENADQYDIETHEITQVENIRVYFIDPEDLFVKVQLYEWNEPSASKAIKGTKSTQGTWTPVWEKPQVPIAGGQKLTEIPFFFFGAEDNTPNISQSPLLDLANVNIAHWKMSADLAHGLHYTALPTPWAAGFDTKSKLYIGPGKAWISSDPQATCGYMEFTGQGLKAIENDLDRKEKQMAVLGSRLIEGQRVGIEAAETARIRQSGEVNSLITISKLASKTLSRMLEVLALWRSVPTSEETTVELNTDFIDISITPEEITALLGALQAGKISHETFLWNLKEGELLPPGVSIEDEKEKIEVEAGPEFEEKDKFEHEPNTDGIVSEVIKRIMPGNDIEEEEE